ncbi:MAG: tRNA (adenosine(37)-N6)-threonylcarbamoyltransferase complex ATPase subunit type 1 TsaE [Chloroflexota bacterium]|nr:tRNA (adenosine(37)-N6)-threonylcarbamoyltransferase complex ATPase subunit type 1 TsaE [Chloroflexota bacterium]
MTQHVKSYRTDSEHATYDLGKLLAQQLRAGDVVLLYGSIGAGKSVMARAIGDALGVSRWSGSPTFSLVHEYHTIPAFYHADLYRLSSGDVADLGLDEYAQNDSILAIEWADRAQGLLADLATGRTILIELAYSGEDSREVQISGLPNLLAEPALAVENGQ